MLKIATQFHPDGSCSEYFSAVLIFSKCRCFVLLLILQIDVRNVGNKIIPPAHPLKGQGCRDLACNIPNLWSTQLKSAVMRSAIKYYNKFYDNELSKILAN